MKYAIDRQENYACIVLQEEKLETSVAPSLKGEFVFLTNEGVQNIILDLSSVNFADSSGLSAILVGNRLTKQNDGVFILCGLTTPVQKLVQISHLDSVLNIMDTKEEAVEALLLHLSSDDEGGDEWEEEEGIDGDDDNVDGDNQADDDLDDVEWEELPEDFEDEK